MVVSHPKPLERPHPTYLSPQGKAAIAAHHEVLRQQRDSWRASRSQVRRFLEALLLDIDSPRVHP